jgi:hypothetical protein
MEAKSPYKAISLDLDLINGADYTLVVTGHLSAVILEVIQHHEHNLSGSPVAYPGFTSTAGIVVFPFRAVGKMRVRLTAPQDYNASPWHISCDPHTIPTF